jgi:hypothetical protein
MKAKVGKWKKREEDWANQCSVRITLAMRRNSFRFGTTIKGLRGRGD